jgi:histone H3/H4
METTLLFPMSNQAIKTVVRQYGITSVQPEAITLIKDLLAEAVCRIIHKTTESVDSRGQNVIYLDDIVETLKLYGTFCSDVGMTMNKWRHWTTEKPKQTKKKTKITRKRKIEERECESSMSSLISERMPRNTRSTVSLTSSEDCMKRKRKL